MKATMKKINMPMMLIALFFLAGIGIATAQDTAAIHHEFSAKQAVDYALKNNVQVKNALLEVKIQEQTNRELTGIAYPQISGSGSLVYNWKLPVSLVPAEFFGGTPGTFEKFPFGVKWNATGGISLNQIIFDGQVFIGLKARDALIDFQEKNVEVTEETVIANVYKVYYQLVASKTQIELLDENIARLEKLQHDTRIMFDNGFAERLDVDKLAVQIANLQTEKVAVIARVSNGYLGLKVLMGMPVREELVLTDTLNDSMIRDAVLDASQFNYSQRAEYQYANIGLQLKEYDIKRYKQAKIPTLSFNGYYNKNAQRNDFSFFKEGDWFDVSALTLTLNVPIFQGFAANARIARAKISMQQSLNQLEALKINIDNEILTAQNNFSAALSSLNFQQKNMELAQTVFDQTRKKFEAGTGSQTEINTAQTDLKTAQNNYINALYTAIIARVDFLKATGRL